MVNFVIESLCKIKQMATKSVCVFLHTMTFLVVIQHYETNINHEK